MCGVLVDRGSGVHGVHGCHRAGVKEGRRAGVGVKGAALRGEGDAVFGTQADHYGLGGHVRRCIIEFSDINWIFRQLDGYHGIGIGIGIRSRIELVV